jgi:hypothetical protein
MQDIKLLDNGVLQIQVVQPIHYLVPTWVQNTIRPIHYQVLVQRNFEPTWNIMKKNMQAL